jgi:hypothetical protein
MLGELDKEGGRGVAVEAFSFCRSCNHHLTLELEDNASCGDHNANQAIQGAASGS